MRNPVCAWADSMALFWNTAGLAATAQAESGGNYTAQNPGSTASGAYQFLNSTWQQYQSQYNQAYGTDYNYPAAYQAPPSVQDQVASITPVSNWGGTWAGSGGANAANPAYTQLSPLSSDELASYGNYAEGYNSGLTSQPDFTDSAIEGLDSNLSGLTDEQFVAAENANSTGTSFISPTASGLQGLPTGGEQFVGTIPAGSAGALSMIPGAMLSANIGLGSGVANDVSTWVQSLGHSVVQGFDSAVEGVIGPVSNWVLRGFIILIAIVIVAVALWSLAGPGRQAVARTMKV